MSWAFQPLLPAAAQQLSVGSTAGYIKYWDGDSWELKPVKCWNGTTWNIKPVKYWDGGSWVET